MDAFFLAVYVCSMQLEDSLDKRLAVLAKVMDSPPAVHPTAPNGVWSTDQSCYELLANHVRRGSRTLETGAGLSTILFAAWGCEHLAVVPYPSEASAIEAYCAENGISTDSLTFDLRPSEVALPSCSAQPGC